MTSNLPLEGTRILDLTRLLPGPYATQLLGDMGATVVKVEQPGTGDYMRDMEPRLADGESHVFSILNRNKESVSLDLKDERGQEAFLTLAEEADAVVEGFRPGVVDRLGIDYETVRARNESIVYCSLTGFGQDSPYLDWAGHDINYIGVGGLLGMTGEADEKPTVPGLPVADYAGGMLCAFSLMVGLFQAAQTGEGDYYDVSMTDTIVSWLTSYAADVLNPQGTTPERGETQPAGKYPCYQVYETADGNYVTLGAMEFHFWVEFCETVGLEQYANEGDHYPEGERLAEVEAAVADVFASKTRAEWIEALDESAVPIAPVNDLDEVWSDPHVEARGLLAHLDVDGERVPVVDNPVETGTDHEWVRSPHPALGEDSEWLLVEAGVSREVIDELVADGVIDRP